jgi:hypothetical protein
LVSLTRFQTAEYDGLSPSQRFSLAFLLTQKEYFMHLKIRNTSLYLVLAVLAIARTSEAQAPLGIRAQGLAGAFVAVADDASAVYWNPAGLATGAIVSSVIALGEQNTAPDAPQDAAGERDTGMIVALSLPPVGLAYYRVGTYGTAVATSAVSGLQSREEVRRSVHALVTSTIGVSLLQSLTDHIVVAATPKVVRGSAASGFSSALLAGGGLDAAADLERRDDTTFDIDAAVMVSVDRLRAGVVARNLTTPAFAIGNDSEIELTREVRAGLAWGSAWPGNSSVALSFDADLMSRLTPLGDRRDIAGGVETWWWNRAIAVRAGARRSTVGASRGAVTGGVSYAVRPSIFVEGHVAAGERSERGWSVGVRAGF